MMNNQSRNITVNITDITSTGAGVGRSSPDEPVVFVPGTIPGETIECEITDERRNYAFAVLTNIVKRSKSRIKPDCKFYPKCPGCSLQHIKYSEQVHIKSERVAHYLEKAIGRTFQPEVIPSPASFGYRTHITLSCEKTSSGIIFGFVEHDEHQIFMIDKCLLIPDWANTELSRLRKFLNGNSDRLPDRFKLRIFLEFESKQMYVVSPRGATRAQRRLPHSLKSILKEFNPPSTIDREILGVTIKLHPSSFIQANHYLTSRLYQSALDRCNTEKNDVLCELYSGSGFFSLSLAPKVKKTIAIEADKRSCENLRRAASQYLEPEEKSKNRKSTPDIEIAFGPAEDLAAEIFERYNPTLIIANPPRSSLHKNVTSAISECESVNKIVMISCDPQTCARDLKSLIEAGFVPDTPTLIDLYPQTAHMEIVVGLSR